MKLEKKDMGRNKWSRVIERRFVHRRFDDEKFRGVAGLIHLEKTTGSLTKIYGDYQVTIAGDGYQWLQLAPEGEHYWLTAMYDPRGRAVQYYFDITYENHLEGDNPYFDDLFLDMVLLPGGEWLALDEDELEAAARDGQISKENRDLAWRTAWDLRRRWGDNLEELDQFCAHYYEIMKKELA